MTRMFLRFLRFFHKWLGFSPAAQVPSSPADHAEDLPTVTPTNSTSSPPSEWRGLESLLSLSTDTSHAKLN